MERREKARLRTSGGGFLDAEKLPDGADLGGQLREEEA
jgi:hypothetical protein